MSRKSLDQTLEVIQAIDRARTHEEVCTVLLDASRRFGFEHILAGTIPRTGSSRSQQMSHVVLDHWPAEWSRRYFSHGYLFVDPAIKRVTESRSPFLWSEIAGDSVDDAAARRVMNEAGDFRLRDGFTVPLMTLEGEVAGFSLAGERLEVTPTARGMLTLLATYALVRSLQLRASQGAPSSRVNLSMREREALQWAAEGKTELEIGDLMSISRHGVDKHMRAARLKLASRNRTHAVAEAIRLGIVR
ncbi:MAG: autoinducer binding domain-containing protein [Salinarimonas sp.]